MLKINNLHCVRKWIVSICYIFYCLYIVSIMMTKKLFTIAGLVAICLSTVVWAQSFSTVYNWMFSNGLTTMSETNFRPNDQVTRGEISKFFAKFAEVKELEKTKSASECQFNDVDGYDHTLVPTIVEACQYGLVKGSNGSYFPNKSLTEAEALTVVVRSLLGFQDETATPRWTEYYNAGKWLGILDNETLWGIDKPATRQTVGTWLYKAALVDPATIENQGSDELEAILKEIFGEEVFAE